MSAGPDDTAWLSRVAGVPLRPDRRVRATFRGVLHVEGLVGPQAWAVASSEQAFMAVLLGSKSPAAEAAIHDSHGFREGELGPSVAVVTSAVRAAAHTPSLDSRPFVPPSALRHVVSSHARGEGLGPCRYVTVATPSGDRYVAARLLRGALSLDEGRVFPLWFEETSALALVGLYGGRRALVVAAALRVVCALDRETGRVGASAP